MLFHEIIFGPVMSRRLGFSLGINLLPECGKLCNFDCVYCECGLAKDGLGGKRTLPSAKQVEEALKKRLAIIKEEGQALDAITFAGNGEPTMHPEFSEIIDLTIEARNNYYPSAKVSVLSNATLLHKDKIFDALLKTDNTILKLDSGKEETIKKINQPAPGFSLEKLKENLKKFNGNFILQAMFLRASGQNLTIDNTTPEEIEIWLKVVKELNPKMVMIYSIARKTPFDEIEKISFEELDSIASRVRETGIDVMVS